MKTTPGTEGLQIDDTEVRLFRACLEEKLQVALHHVNSGYIRGVAADILKGDIENFKGVLAQLDARLSLLCQDCGAGPERTCKMGCYVRRYPVPGFVYADGPAERAMARGMKAGVLKRGKLPPEAVVAMAQTIADAVDSEFLRELLESVDLPEALPKETPAEDDVEVFVHASRCGCGPDVEGRCVDAPPGGYRRPRRYL